MTLDHLNRLYFVTKADVFRSFYSVSRKLDLAFRVKKKSVCFDVVDATNKSVLRLSLAAHPVLISTKLLYNNFYFHPPPGCKWLYRFVPCGYRCVGGRRLIGTSTPLLTLYPYPLSFTFIPDGLKCSQWLVYRCRF